MFSKKQIICNECNRNKFPVQINTINIINKKRMKTKTIKPSNIDYFPLQQLQRIVQQQKPSYKHMTSKKIMPSRAVIKNHSKSLYYYSNLTRNLKPNILSAINKTGVNLTTNAIHQTLNQELMGMDKAKPKTSHHHSGRNKDTDRDNLRTNKVSLRSSSNYNKLSSIAGISVNEQQAQQRMESNINTKNNKRKDKRFQIHKENKRLGSRMDSLQSQYSTKKLLKAYESHQKISKRLTESKMSKRSNSIHDNTDNRSVYSQNSSRASVKSGVSRNSQTNSMKSTSRANSSKSSSRNKGFNRFPVKLPPTKTIKIEQHNINKMNEDQLSKFKRLFANSFSTVKEKPHKILVSNQTDLSYQKMLKNNPYVDVQVRSQKSDTSMKNQRTPNKERSHNYSFSNSIRKLRQLNVDVQKSNQFDKFPKKSSAITSDGLLHRIAEQIYSVNNNGNTDDVSGRQQKAKRQSNTAIKSTENKANQIRNPSSDKNSKGKPIRAEFNYPILPTRQMFSKF